MSVRERRWTTSKGQERRAWVVDYVDLSGTRRLKTFRHKKLADGFRAKTHVEISEGTHVPDSASATVEEAGELWLKSVRQAGLEQTTVDQYEQHLTFHILPLIGATKLSKLSVPAVRAFEDQLATTPRTDPPNTKPLSKYHRKRPSKHHGKLRSTAMIRRVISSLGALLGDAQERGLVVRNAVSELRRNGRRKGSKRGQDRRNGKLKIGVHIPDTKEVRALLANADGRWRPLLLTAVFTGLRASELRGLRWDDVDLKKDELHVRQRADRFNQIGPPKSEAGERTLPLPPTVVKELREWKLKCPKGPLGLVFPNGSGNVENHHNIAQRGLIPTMIKAGITKPVLDAHGKPKRDEDGKPIVAAKYTGLHALRHFFASWCINREKDGGLELPLKVVQERLGHASITMTADRYGHLFPRGDDSEELAAAELHLLGRSAETSPSI